MTRYGATTATGTRHELNEDSLGEAPRRGVWVVADGMGGHAAGGTASKIFSVVSFETGEMLRFLQFPVIVYIERPQWS